MNNKDQLIKIRDELNVLIEQEEKPQPSKWGKCPFKIGDEIWFCGVGSDGPFAWKIKIIDEIGLEIYQAQWRVGMAFLTKQECERKIKRMEAEAKIQRFADYVNGDRIIDWNDGFQRKYYFCLGWPSRELTRDYTFYYKKDQIHFLDAIDLPPEIEQAYLTLLVVEK